MTTPQTETEAWVPSLTFAARLALVRHQKGWNIKEAALACGISPQSWRGWELEHRLPHDQLEVAEQISTATGVDLDWLLRGGPLAAEVRRRRDRGKIPPSSHGGRTATTRHLTSAVAHRTGPQTGHAPAMRRTPKEAGTRPRWTHGR